jgi:hypothetical protein
MNESFNIIMDINNSLMWIYSYSVHYIIHRVIINMGIKHNRLPFLQHSRVQYKTDNNNN